MHHVFAILLALCFGSLDSVGKATRVHSNFVNKEANHIPSSEKHLTTATPILTQLSRDIQTVFQQNQNAVVKVLRASSNEDGAILYGTGFFFDQHGHILTSATVASGDPSLWIEFQDIAYSAKVLGSDPVTNLAVLELAELPPSFSFIRIPEHKTWESMPIGECVIAIGSTKGLKSAPKFGIVTGEDLIYGDHTFIVPYLRSSLEIIGGESGSPIFDSQGRFCGILIASLPDIRSSFIIPQHVLLKITEALKLAQSVDYASAGFGVRGQVSSSGRKEIVISSLSLPPEKASAGTQLAIGDVILSIDHVAIHTENDIASVLFFKKPGQSVHVTVQRTLTNSDGDLSQEQKTIEITLRKRQ